MKITEYHNITFYEDYVFGRLTKEDEDQFEEHLLLCSHCRKELDEVEQIVKESRLYQTDQEQHLKSVRFNPWKYTGIAASILIILSAGSIFLVNKKNNKIVKNIVVEDTIPHIQQHEEEIVAQETLPEKQDIIDEEYVNTVSYNVLPVFENAIKNISRSEHIEIISPKQIDSFKVGDSIVFNWHTALKNLGLVIFSNTGEVLFEQSVQLPFTYPEKLKNGLYYWQVESETESLFTGKFAIK